MDQRRRQRIFGFRKKTEDKDKDKDSSEFEKSLKTFEDRNFFEDIRRIEDFCQNIKENMQSEKYVS